MSVHRPTLHDCAASNCNEISKYMPVTRWKAIKSLLFGLAITLVGVVAIVSDGDPTRVGITAIVMLYLVGQIDVKEVEIARWLSVTFRKKDDDKK